MKLYKIRKGKYYFITAIFLGCLILSFFNINVYESQIIGTYIDGKETEQLPTKNSGYAVEKIVCDNSQNVSWDYHKWGIKLTNLSKRGRCSVYFKTLEKVNISKVSFYVDEVQRCPTVNDDGSLKGNVEDRFTEKEYGYICSAPDAYGTSYYFRGNVTDNYVYFAGFYWRIMRINGDGTVRVIYNGKSAYSNGKFENVATSYFNKFDNDPAYVGYMYGNLSKLEIPLSKSDTISSSSSFYLAKGYTEDTSNNIFSLKNPVLVKGSDINESYLNYYRYFYSGEQTRAHEIYKMTSMDSSGKFYHNVIKYGSSNFQQAQTNTNDSTIKTAVDKWYESNIKGTTYENYLTDNIFCNDRSICEGSGSTDQTIKTSFCRKKTLICPQKNDAFTVNDTSKGNGALKYPVGLISAAEASLNDYFIGNSNEFWTATPHKYGNGYSYYGDAEGCYVSSHKITCFFGVNDFSWGVNPVINLKSDIFNNGSGTMDDPYHI